MRICNRHADAIETPNTPGKQAFRITTTCGRSEQQLLHCGMPVQQTFVAQVIDAEMARRKLLEESPIASTQEEPVLFDTSEIPWWAWVRRFHLPEVYHQLLSDLGLAIDFVDRVYKLQLL